jgi:hypothetical protein
MMCKIHKAALCSIEAATVEIAPDPGNEAIGESGMHAAIFLRSLMTDQRLKIHTFLLRSSPHDRELDRKAGY